MEHFPLSQHWNSIARGLTAATLLLVAACAPAAPPSPTAAPAKPAPTAAPAKPEAPKPAAAPAKPTEGPAAKPAEAKPAASPAAKAEAKPAEKPAAKPAAAQPKVAEKSPDQPGSPADWERTLAAAKQEGRVTIAGPAAATYREALSDFQRAHGITVEYFGLGGRDFVPRVMPERQAGQYLWDIHVGGAGTPAQTLKPAGVLDPLKPALMQPEVLDDSKWLGGFDEGFYDVEKRYVFSYVASLRYVVYVNRDVVPESELNRIEQLLDPKWKGKIISDEVRAFGAGCGAGAHVILVLGEDWLRKFFAQDVTLSRERRQIAEFIVRGQYPIALGLDNTELARFQSEGLGKNVKPLAPETDVGSRISQQSGSVQIINRPAHPNAAKVYVNWLLSKDGQSAWVGRTKEDSRRLDAPPGPPEFRPDPRRKYPGDVAREDLLYLPDRCVEIGKEMFK